MAMSQTGGSKRARSSGATAQFESEAERALDTLPANTCAGFCTTAGPALKHLFMMAAGGVMRMVISKRPQDGASAWGDLTVRFTHTHLMFVLGKMMPEGLKWVRNRKDKEVAVTFSVDTLLKNQFLLQPGLIRFAVVEGCAYLSVSRVSQGMSTNTVLSLVDDASDDGGGGFVNIAVGADVSSERLGSIHVPRDTTVRLALDLPKKLFTITIVDMMSTTTHCEPADVFGDTEEQQSGVGEVAAYINPAMLSKVMKNAPSAVRVGVDNAADPHVFVFSMTFDGVEATVVVPVTCQRDDEM